MSSSENGFLGSLSGRPTHGGPRMMSSGNSPSSNAVPGPSRSSPQTQQSSIEALDFGTSWMLPGLSPGQPRESTMATDILDLYDRPSSVTPEPLLKDSVPDVSQQTIPAAGSSTEVQRSESTSPNWTLDRPPRRLPSGPRPLPSSSNSSYRSLGSSSNHIDGHVPEDYHSSWAQRPRPAFRPIASSEQAKQSFESMRSSSDFSERSNSSLAAAATRNRSIRTANEDAHQLRPLQEVESPSQLHPTIIETPPLPVPPKNASAAASPSGDFPSPIGHPQTSPYTTARPSPSSSLTGNQFLQRNTSTGTMISTPMGESDTELHCNQALLSNMATWLKDRVPRAEHVRGAIPYPMSFTGRDIVSTLERALSDAFKSRRIALHVARSLHTQLFFFEIRDNEQPVNDGLDQVFVFPEDDGGGATWDEIPSAVLTEVTGCYSPLCSSLSRQGFITGGCLSPSCPNNHHATNKLRRQISFSGEAEPPPQVKGQGEESAWAETVEPELLQLLGKKEVERQNQIHELITGEATYVRDIELLRTEFLEPLTEADPPIIPPDEQSAFFADVLINAFDIKQQAMAFSEALSMRQREQEPVIQKIGDVVINAALDWGASYVEYAKLYPFADARIKQEKAKNPAFDQFLTAFTRRPATRKLAVHSYQTRITIRLQRYILLLKGILKHTADDNLEDRQALQQAIDIIDQQCKESDSAVAASEAILECRRYDRDLIGLDGYLSDLELKQDGRTLIKKGKMYRRSESSGFNDWNALHVVLFDNFLVITKERSRGSSNTQYQIVRRPIPLQLLTATGFDDSPWPKSSRLNLRPTLSADAHNSHGARDDKMLYPITFNYAGRGGGITMLFVESAQARQEWREALHEAIERREQYMSNQEVLQLDILSHGTFMPRNRYVASRPEGGSLPHGRPTCSTSFTTPEGHQLLAVGHDDGLWIGLHGDPTSLKLVLHLKGISQCAVLQNYGLFLVLAARVLIAYPFEALVPSAASVRGERESKEPQRLSGSKDVLFFKVGCIAGKLLVIYVKKDGVTQTVFKALEPIPIGERGTKGFMRRKVEYLKDFKEFFIPSEVFDLFYLRSQLSIVCAKGFELMAIQREPLRSISFPDWNQLRGDNKAMDLQRRCNDSRAVAMFRISDAEFLFVFEDLAFYADKHGDPLQRRYSDVIDWQGTARAVAHMPPYILAFDSNFIEVRYAATGKLVQLIKGIEISCTNDGQGFGSDVKSINGGLDKSVQVALRMRDSAGVDSYVVADLVSI